MRVVVRVVEHHVSLSPLEPHDRRIRQRADADIEERRVDLLGAEVLQRLRPVERRAVVERERDPVRAAVRDLLIAASAHLRARRRQHDAVLLATAPGR